MLSDVIYDFGFGEAFAHSVMRADQVETAEARPGLYAWFVRTPRLYATEDRCSPFRSIHADRNFNVQASASLGETIAGKIKRGVADVRLASPTDVLDSELFAGAFAAFSPPVYIGRSKNVRSRLGQHLRSLNQTLSAPSLPAAPTQKELSDTDEESSQFGVRMGRLLRRYEIGDTRSLFIKVVYATENDATKRAELLLNRTFHPVLGRL